MKRFVVFFALSLVACSSNATSLIPAKVAQPNVAQRSQSRALQSKYVYVTDAAEKALLVYPAGVINPAPIRTVSLGDTPEGVAVDSTGKVYVALYNTSTIDVFAPGAGSPTPLRTITNDINRPYGLAIDVNDELYVSSHCQSASGCQGTYVAEFTLGANKAFRRILAPATAGLEGIAVRNGTLFMDVYGSLGGIVVQYIDGKQTGLYIPPVASCAGVAIDNNGNLFAASGGALAEFAPPSYAYVTLAQYPSEAIRLIGRGSDGSIYVPFYGSSPSVVVWSNGSQTPYTITNGLSEPMGAAAD